MKPSLQGAEGAGRPTARLIVAELNKWQDAPHGIAGMGEFGGFRMSSQIPARARQLLAPYVHPEHVGIA